MKGCSRMRMDLHPYSGFRRRQLKPKRVQPTIIEDKPSHVCPMIRMHDLSNRFRRMPFTCPEYLALASTFAALTKNEKRLIENGPWQAIDHRTSPLLLCSDEGAVCRGDGFRPLSLSGLRY